MSWYVRVCAKVETNNDGVEYVTVENCGNYTYSVSPMFYDVLEDGLRGLSDKQCKDVSEALVEAVQKMEKNPEKYKAMNPENGWGDYEGALKFLESIKNASIKYPNCYINIF